MDLITRRVIERLEGTEVTDEILQEYTDPESPKYEQMVEEIRKELSALLRTVKDPRVSEGMLTITRVDTTNDLRYARVYISALNCQDEKGLMKGLKSAAGYLRHQLGQAIDLRYTPELQFIMDDSIAHGAHILDLLNHVKPANPANADIVLPEDQE